jgi:hypothetical protein
MKKTIILLALTILTIAAACQGKDKVFTTLVKFNQGIQFGDGTIQLTAASGGGSTAWSAITGKPTTLTGYGITDAAPLSHNHAGTYEPYLANPTVSGYVLTSTTSGTRSWTALPTGGSMTYPGAGIPLSTGTAWGTSIVNNSANWNTAYSWGNHAGLYRPVAWVPTFAQITSKPTTLSGYGITDAALSTHNHSTLYRPITYVPTWSEVTGKPLFHIVATSGSYNDLSDKPEVTELSEALPTLLGIKLPVLTQTQINALTPVKGLLLFNDTDGVLQIFNGTVWKTVVTTN